MNTKPARANILLSTGRVVTHRREPNGSQFAWIANDPDSEMTPEEWDEYCTIIRGANVKELQS